MEQTFEAGTVIRCNRCNAAGEAPRPFDAARENSNAWRITGADGMMIHPTCGHLDGHWVFDSDNQHQPPQQEREAAEEEERRWTHDLIPGTA